MFKETGRVFVFHQINDDKTCWKDVACSITADSFARFIYKLKESDAVFGNLDEAIQAKSLDDNKRVYLTFDDAYSDVYYNCFPLLKENNIPFTVFVSCELLSKEGYLSKSMLLEMMDEGLCTIGSHTINHLLLRKQPAYISFREINDSKSQLEVLFGQNITLFAYPYGSIYACSRRDIGYTKEAGYSLAFSTLRSPLSTHRRDNPYFLPRINVNEGNYIVELENTLKCRCLQ